MSAQAGDLARGRHPSSTEESSEEKRTPESKFTEVNSRFVLLARGVLEPADCPSSAEWPQSCVVAGWKPLRQFFVLPPRDLRSVRSSNGLEQTRVSLPAQEHDSADAAFSTGCIVRRKVRQKPRRMSLGKTVKALRERRHFSQIMLAKRAQLTQPYLAQIERGIRTNPSLRAMRSIAKALGVSLDRLIRS